MQVKNDDYKKDSFLRNCPSCGAEIDNEMMFCPKCGIKIDVAINSADLQSKIQKTNEKLKKKHKKAKASVILIATILALTILIAILIPKVAIPTLRYIKAEKLVVTENYDDAIKIFNLLGEYKDSDKKILDAKYKKGENFLKLGNYQSAIDVFTEIVSYSNAKERILEAHYMEGEFLLASGEWESAVTAFVNAGNYADATKKIPEVYYKKAETLLESNQYDLAIEAFEKAEKYKDSDERILDIKYKQAEEMLLNNDSKSAINAFRDLGNYRDAQDRVVQLVDPMKQIADEHIANKNYEAAFEILDTIADEESINKITSLSYQLLLEKTGGGGVFSFAKVASILSNRYVFNYNYIVVEDGVVKAGTTSAFSRYDQEIYKMYYDAVKDDKYTYYSVKIRYANGNFDVCFDRDFLGVSRTYIVTLNVSNKTIKVISSENRDVEEGDYNRIKG